MWKYAVIQTEFSYEVNDVRGDNTIGPMMISKSCWDIVYSVPLQDIDWMNNELWDGCLAWIENNKVEGSKYVILKMFFV